VVGGVLTIDLSVGFMKGSFGDRVTAEGKVLHGGKSTAFCEPRRATTRARCSPRRSALSSSSPTREKDRVAASARRNTKRFEHRPEVLGCFALERHALARSRMHESEDPRMEHRARRFDLPAGVIADIHAFTDQGMAELGLWMRI